MANVAPISSPLVDKQGIATSTMQRWMVQVSKASGGGSSGSTNVTQIINENIDAATRDTIDSLQLLSMLGLVKPEAFGQSSSSENIEDIIQSFVLAGVSFQQINKSSVDIYEEALGGTKDSSNDTFTLRTAPNPQESLRLYWKGLRMCRGVNYTITDKTVVMLAGSIPDSGDSLIADYKY